MTTISPRLSIAPVAPLPSSQTIEAPKQEGDATPAPQVPDVAVKPNWLFDQITAESEQRYQRGLLLIEAFQEGLNKMKAEQDITTGKAMLKHLNKTLSVPFKNPEKIIGDAALKIINDGAEIMRNRLGHVPPEYSFMYDGTDVLYNVKLDGSVFKRYSWAAETKEIYDRASVERSGLSSTLFSGVYEGIIKNSQSRISEILGKIGPLSEGEQNFLSGFASIPSGSISLIA